MNRTLSLREISSSLGQPTIWEAELLSLAHTAAITYPVEKLSIASNSPQLDAAYRYCESVTAHHSRSFFCGVQFLAETATTSLSRTLRLLSNQRRHYRPAIS
jgi:hypothetical protein